MAQRICRFLSFFFLLLSSLLIYCSGNLESLSKDSRNSRVASSVINTSPTLKLNKGFLFQIQDLCSNYSVDIYLKQAQLGDMRSYKASSGVADEFVQSLISKASVASSLLSHAHVPIVVSFRRSSRRMLLASFVQQATKHDSVTNPTTIPSNLPPFSSTPTIITIPSTNPMPSTTPIPMTPTNPIPNPAAPFVTNPVTTYPVTSPVTTPVTAPATTNTPQTVPQIWCIARSGADENALQAALDYACGIADCSLIQQGASCFDPNTLENHASFAFNSYFLKNPVASSCDFGGTAALAYADPSSASCVYPSAAATSVPSIVSPATTASSSGATGTEPSYGSTSPPSIFNPSNNPIYNPSSNPSSGSSTGYGSEFPPLIVAPPSQSTSVQSYLDIITLIASLATGLLLGL